MPVLYSGDDHLLEEIDSLKFRIGPLSFYQTNTLQAGKLYAIAKEFAGLTGRETVYDLYTGAGTIACYVAGEAGKVIGMEYVDAAVEDAVINSGINNIGNTEFYAGDIRLLLNEKFIQEKGRPDVIITDPRVPGCTPMLLSRYFLPVPQG